MSEDCEHRHGFQCIVCGEVAESLTPEIRAVVEAAKALVSWWSDAEYSDEMDEQPMKLIDAVLALRRAEEKETK